MTHSPPGQRNGGPVTTRTPATRSTTAAPARTPLSREQSSRTDRPAETSDRDLARLAEHESRVGWCGEIPPGHYAVADPHEPGRHTMWRVRAGVLEPWPKQAINGPQVAAYRRDVPRDRVSRGAFWEERRSRRRAYLDEVATRIEAAPERAAASYAAHTFRCALCNRPLRVPESNGYGIGPECRSWMPADLLAEYARQVSELRFERAAGGAA